ncbi:MAG: SEL1-like repeat protein [Kofleriaceae bacterium]|nr:SEL1-like repeat protein [Kofleriaceae bacterium]MBP9169078.1 SEL1-like repeat protein [Kofleriaceae bacterium]MBP9858745.1 SEL1-like repeat protein [Kofleriaceae bacterium]
MLRAAAIVAVTLALFGEAHAIDRACPTGQAWSPNLGACVARQATPKASPAARYYEASAGLDSGRADEIARARRTLAATCAARHAASCTLLGFVLERGRGGAADPAAAVERYQRGCDLGDVDGCLAAAAVWALGLVGDPAPTKAIAPLERACALGSGRGCYALAGKYDAALGVGHDAARARDLYRRAVTRLTAECPGSGPACYDLGVAQRDGRGMAADAVAAARAFAAGCEAGAGAACLALGELYRDGQLGPNQRDRALAYFEQSCERYDNADGCHAAGGILAERPGGDPTRLAALGERACALSTARCDLTAYLFATGAAGLRDEARATAAYLTACQAGNPTACSAAATRIAHGAGTRADGALAVKIWERACATGAGGDCFQAAIAYRDGALIAADRTRAQGLFEVGCLRGSAAACEDAGLERLDAGDGEAARALLSAGCALGRGETCTLLGEVAADDDPAAAEAAFTRGCEAPTPDSAACAALAAAREGAAGLTAATRACRLGDAASCAGLDERARAAAASPTVRATTLDAIAAGCAASPPVEAACTAAIGLYASGGYLTAPAPRRAVALAASGCERGSGSACLALADALAEGAGVVADPGAARARYAALCDRDEVAACWRLGALLYDDGRPVDGARLFARACDAGLAAACTSLGNAAYTGRGAPWEVARARELYRRACDAGDDLGCANLGELDELGVGAPPDPAAAVALYQRACDDVAIAGCARLAAAHVSGLGGVDRDRPRALALATRACDAGNAEGCALAATLTAAGPTAAGPTAAGPTAAGASRVAQLRQWAFDLARDEAEANPYAAYLLGRFHADGVGTARDEAAARTWYDRACEGRDPAGCLAAGAAWAARADGDRAVAAYDRACGAGVETGCRAAAAVRRRLPLTARGCGCGGAPTPAGFAPLALVAVALRRRRGRAPR